MNKFNKKSSDSIINYLLVNLVLRWASDSCFMFIYVCIISLTNPLLLLPNFIDLSFGMTIAMIIAIPIRVIYSLIWRVIYYALPNDIVNSDPLLFGEFPSSIDSVNVHNDDFTYTMDHRKNYEVYTFNVYKVLNNII